MTKVKKQGLDFIDEIIRIVSEKIGISPDEIVYPTRKREIVQARQLCMAYAKEFTRGSLTAIGERIGGKDHSTVLHAIKSVKNDCDTDKGYLTLYNSIRMEIKLTALKKSRDIMVCQHCGSTNLQAQVMISLETMKVIGDIDYNDKTSIWCNSCNQNTKGVKEYIYCQNKSLSEKISTLQ